MPRTRSPRSVPIAVQVTQDRTPHIAEYAEERVRSVFRYAHQPVLYARVRLSRHGDPALARPVVAQANLDVNGHAVRAEAVATTAREAVDRLRDRLRQRVQHHSERVGADWEARRGGRPSGEPHEWRHGDLPAPRAPYFPRPAEERQIIRHKSFGLSRCDVDEAASDMEAMDYGFYLFTEVGSGQDSVLHRASEGYLLSQVQPRPEALVAHTVSLTVDAHPAPALNTAEAVERMAVWDRPFLFFLDRERGHGAVLYHRYDGHYGLITPAEPGGRA